MSREKSSQGFDAVKTAAFATGLALGIGAGLTAWLRRTRAQQMRGKVIVITGGSRGLGLAIARQFGLAGCHLVLAARDAEELQRARIILAQQNAAHNAASIEMVVADVSTRDGARAIADAARARYGRIDVLVNNAGIIQVAPFVDLRAEDFESAMQTNFFAALYMIQEVVGDMRERGSGHIVNIASIGGKVPVPHLLSYVASKFALVGLSEGLCAELAQDGINVTTVCPGLMRTGSHIQASFGGQRQAEYDWFALGATVPGINASAQAAARKIFRATAAGSREVTIEVSAWIAARANGLAPGLTAQVAGKVNQIALPKPAGTRRQARGAELRQPTNKIARAWRKHLEEINNQTAENI